MLKFLLIPTVAICVVK
uniref:Uncharacterized protein n=1 Tax=Rhizophora mucronata TaxID=61149 RepID=A0A2P2NSE5_RHIMU